MSESFYAIRRTDREQMFEVDWLTVQGPDDWAEAKDYLEASEIDGPVEFEIVQMTVETVAKQTFSWVDPNP